MKREVELGQGEVLFLSDGSHTVGAIKAAERKHVFIETEEEELVQFLDEDDLIAVSCFFGGQKAKEAILCMLHLVGQSGMPLLVLSKGHPATKRLQLVISAGERIRLTSCVIPGTHPEQDVLCARGGLDGLVLTGIGENKIRIEGGDGITVETAPALSFSSLK